MKIVISGTIGVGKSTISKLLSESLKEQYPEKKIVLFEEIQNDNPYFDYFYQNRPEWSFLIQIDFLLERFRNVIKEQNKIKKENDHIIIYDRHFLDDYVFSQLYSIKEDVAHMQLNLYQHLNNYLSERILRESAPDYIFILKADFNEILYRVQNRGRDFEKAEDLYPYWKDVYYQYYQNPIILDYFKKHAKNVYILDNSTSEETIKKILKLIKFEN